MQGRHTVTSPRVASERNPACNILTRHERLSEGEVKVCLLPQQLVRSDAVIHMRVSDTGLQSLKRQGGAGRGVEERDCESVGVYIGEGGKWGRQEKRGTCVCVHARAHMCELARFLHFLGHFPCFENSTAAAKRNVLKTCTQQHIN